MESPQLERLAAFGNDVRPSQILHGAADADPSALVYSAFVALRAIFFDANYHRNVNIPTTAHFSGTLATLLQSLHTQVDAARLHKFASFYADLAVQDTAMGLSRAPSLLGAAAVLAARYHLRMEPVLPPGLELYAGYSPDELLACMSDLLQYVIVFVFVFVFWLRGLFAECFCVCLY